MINGITLIAIGIGVLMVIAKITAANHDIRVLAKGQEAIQNYLDGIGR